MLNECLDLESVYAIIIFIIFAVTLYGLFTIEHRALKGFVRIVKDWFAFDPSWLGVYPIIWFLYIVGFLDLFTCFNGKFTYLSYILTVPFGIVSFVLVIFGRFARNKEIKESFTVEENRLREERASLYMIYEIIATFFGLVFGTMALWEYLIHVGIVKTELIIASLILPNVISIVGRGMIRQSDIAKFFLRRAKIKR